MKILLTGGSGMVGKNILEYADQAQLDYEIESPLHQELDLLDQQQVQAYVHGLSPDLIIHAAGEVGGIQANIANQGKFLVNNTVMGQNLVLAAEQFGVPRIINLGSSCMYPKDMETPLTEDLILTGPLEPTNEGYAIAKIYVARLLKFVMERSENLAYKTLIPCNLYGRFDNFSPESSHMVPAVIRRLHLAATSNDQSVSIWGTGQARREFMYAGDLADFIWHAVKRFDELPDLTNVGLGHDYSINEYYQAIAKTVSYTGEFDHDVDKPEGMQRKLVNTDRQTSFGWRPAHSLDDGLKNTFDYFLDGLGAE